MYSQSRPPPFSVAVMAGISGTRMAQHAVLLAMCAASTSGVLVSETTARASAFVTPISLARLGSKVGTSQAKATRVSPLTGHRRLSVATLQCAQKDEWEQFVVDLQSNICSVSYTIIMLIVCGEEVVSAGN